MIQKIESKKVELPDIWLVETEEDWNTLPKGLPRIIGKKEELNFIRTFLEFQVLFRSCQKTGMRIKWLDCLKKIGYGNIRNYVLSSGGSYFASEKGEYELKVDDFITDQYVVNLDKLTELKVMPVWLEDLKTAVETNIINEVLFDPTAFNKQLGMNIGGPALKTNKKNLIINDISGSIPDGVRVTLIQLSKLMSKRFYADVIFTGGTTVFLDYEQVMTADIDAITKKISRNNEGEMYKKIVEEYREYGTCVAFGDNDSPDRCGGGSDLKPKFEIENIYSLHTDSRSNEVVGYAKFLKSKNKPILIKDWVNSIN